MTAKQLRAKITDDTLRDIATALTARMRSQKGVERQETLHDIAALLRARRIMSEAKRPDPSDRQPHRGALPLRYWPGEER